VPAAGLSMWVELPVTDGEPFAHLAAARCRVITAAGATHCVDNAHHSGLRLAYAHSADALDEAVRRLAAAWEHHCRKLAVSP
jgi:DNA-binding transcriptional MocR family regulator